MRVSASASALALLALGLGGCGAEPTPVPVDFSAVQGLRVSAILTSRISQSDFSTLGRDLGVLVEHRGGPDECVLSSDVVVSLNGSPLFRESDGGPLVMPDIGGFAGCSATRFSSSRNSALVDLPPAGSDNGARTGTLIVTNGVRTVRMEIPSLLDERSFSITGPDDSVLVPGAQAVVTWSNQSGLVDIQPGIHPFGITLVNGWSDVEHRALAPAVSLKEPDLGISENRMEFTIPPLVAGKGYVVINALIPLRVTRCDGAESCIAGVGVFDAAKEITVESR